MIVRSTETLVPCTKSLNSREEKGACVSRLYKCHASNAVGSNRFCDDYRVSKLIYA